MTSQRSPSTASRRAGSTTSIDVSFAGISHKLSKIFGHRLRRVALSAANTSRRRARSQGGARHDHGGPGVRSSGGREGGPPPASNIARTASAANDPKAGSRRKYASVGPQRTVMSPCRAPTSSLAVRGSAVRSNVPPWRRSKPRIAVRTLCCAFEQRAPCQPVVSLGRGNTYSTESTTPVSDTCAHARAPAKTAVIVEPAGRRRDRKSTRLNSSHGYISYAAFCLKKKKKKSRQENSGAKARGEAGRH